MLSQTACISVHQRLSLPAFTVSTVYHSYKCSDQNSKPACFRWCLQRYSCFLKEDFGNTSHFLSFSFGWSSHNMYNFCSSISYSSSLTVLSYSSRDGTSWEWGSCTCWSFRSTHASRTTTSTCRDSDQLAQCGTYISWVSTSMSWCHRFGSYGGYHWTRTPTASGRRKTDVHELSVGFPPTLYET